MKKIMLSAILVSATLGLSSCAGSRTDSAYYPGFTGYTPPPFWCSGQNYGIGCKHANWYGSGAYYQPGYAHRDGDRY